MSDESVPPTDPELLSILNELAPQEPIFHRAQFARTLGEFDRMMVPDYWEFGASGRRYDREFILRKLENIPPVDAAAAGWETSGFHCRRLGADTYLLTYTLDQGDGRKTRRGTIWRSTPGGWQIVYHQGTLMVDA
ncbi:MAG TPA: DUF4440 domain-containing protein [Acidobacteriaceae bacterium]